MAKSFWLKVPNQRRYFTRQLPDYARLPDLPDMEVPSLVVEPPSTDFDYVAGFDVYPTKQMADTYRFANGGEASLPLRNYRDHRQQYEGAFVARGQHSRKRYMGRSGNRWFFSIYQEKSNAVDFYGEYYVDWDGVGDPWGVGGDKSNMTAGQFFITWAMWAVWFLVNDPTAQYFDPLPTPFLFPQWNALGVGWPWVNYNIPPELLP
jgi:hypothetical protein